MLKLIMTNIKATTKFFNIFLLLSCLLVLGCPVQAQSIDTLFTTAEERDYLDRLRQDFLDKSKERDFDIDESSPPPIIPGDDTNPTITTFKLDGIVTQRNGNHTVWLNNNTVSESELPDNMKIITSNAGLALQITNQGHIFNLKTGQSVDLNSGIIQEAYRLKPLSVAPENTPEPETLIPTNTTVSDDSSETLNNDSNELIQMLKNMEESLSEQ